MVQGTPLQVPEGNIIALPKWAVQGWVSKSFQCRTLRVRLMHYASRFSASVNPDQQHDKSSSGCSRTHQLLTLARQKAQEEYRHSGQSILPEGQAGGSGITFSQVDFTRMLNEYRICTHRHFYVGDTPKKLGTSQVLHLSTALSKHVGF
jgi:hypothetical protein